MARNSIGMMLALWLTLSSPAVMLAASPVRPAALGGERLVLAFYYTLSLIHISEPTRPY